jgi:hypothetical protein
VLAALLLVSMGAKFQSANYVVETADPKLAQQFAETAERYRHDLAIEWLGQTMPNWAQPCQMTVQVGPHLGAGGATSFVFDRGEVYGWRMTIQGSAERVLDSVLPHEITHMVYATHFRRPLPRWADEGGATSVECTSEKAKQRTMLLQFLSTGRGIAFSQMFAMTDYPRDVIPLYAQGYTLSEYLIQHGGRRKFVKFLDDAMQTNQWPEAIQRNYGIADLSALQNTWLAWVRDGFPAPPAAVAVADPRRQRPESNLVLHIHDNVRLASGSSAQSPASGTTTASPVQQTTAILPAGQGDSQVMPASGWHSSAATPSATEATRPQAMEPARQMILQP